ncbi:metallophosphoesterase [Cellulomonas sp. 73-145]|uniref:metallophosphoesterase family protein n=1 Tax=Cellulomonas sp. 73-145 TaxID=1895739 RepID=UPI000AA1EC4B|nr:metallophosphoesterase [Cellulomonas sp. 73-145]MBN9328374.1 metallophosphoesterase [Cellulomonas sp.]
MRHPRFPRRSRRWWLRASLLVLLDLLVAVVVGVTTASVHGSFGPHEARYEVTTDSTVTIDVGPLGTLQVRSPLPLTLGVRATVEEIPDTLTSVDPATTLAALSGDLQSYVQFFSAPQSTVHDVTLALIADAAVRAAVTALLLAGLWYLGRWLLGPARRAELATALRVHRRLVVAVVAGVAVCGTVLTSSTGPTLSRSTAAVSPVFNGTPLQGARVTGRLGGVIDTYGGYVLSAVRENDAFYQAADQALVTAWGSRPADPVVWSRPSPTASPTATPSVSAAGSTAGATGSPTGLAPQATGLAPQAAGLGGAASASPTSSQSASPSPSPTRAQAKLVTVVVVSDLHCNVGMASLLHSVITLSRASLVLDAGDTTLDGTPVEQYCDTTFARAVPAGVALVTSPGNHDSDTTSKRYARSGATVLAGSVVTVDGIRILGDHDPSQTRVGGGTTSVAGETVTDAGARLADVACADKTGVDLLLIHNPPVGQEALDRGCVPAQISGHYHVRTDPEVVGEGVRYISSTTAGAQVNQPTIGPLHGVAELTVLRWDTETRRFVDYRVIAVHPDRTVTVGAAQPWPALPPAPSSVAGSSSAPGPGATGGTVPATAAP